MKKQLLVISMLLSGYVGTSQTIVMALVASQTTTYPTKLKQGEVVEVDLYGTLNSKSDNPKIVSVEKTEYGHTLTARNPGETTIRYTDDKGNEKYTKQVEVAGKEIPQQFLNGATLHIVIPDGHKYKQTNKNEAGAGKVSLKSVRGGFLRIRAKEAGPIELTRTNKNTDTEQVHKMTVIDTPENSQS